MSIKNSHKKSLAAVLSSVVAEMAKPRAAESTKRTGDRSADGRRKHVNPSTTETRVPPRTKHSAIRGRETDTTSVDSSLREVELLH